MIPGVRAGSSVRPYAAAVLATIGVLVASYHVLVERFPSLEGDVCEPTNPCTLIWVRRFGYLTIPAMALSGFAFILVVLAVARPLANDSHIEPTTQSTATGSQC